MDYKEKLKDPRWIKRRREIMERDNHKCMICGEDSVHLNVHHLRYRKDAEPWEYDDYELVTLCEDCHKMVHENNLNLEVRRSKISDRYRLCYGIDNSSVIRPGTVMTSDDMDLIFVCADFPYVNKLILQKFDGSRTNPLDYPAYMEVETQISVYKDGSGLAFNEFDLPINGEMSVEPRPATDEEKEILLNALKKWMEI